MSHIKIRYDFDFGEDSAYFEICLDPKTLLRSDIESTTFPDWALLDFHQCPDCPVLKEDHPHCPVAVNLIPLIDTCGDLASYDEATIKVTTNERQYAAHTTVQRGVSSLLGLLMATSACPNMNFLRPMARFHLPFASDEETTFRAVSTYLMFQYYEIHSGKNADLDLEGLSMIYKKLQSVNRAFSSRLKAACSQDAAVNAVVLLDLFAKDIPYSIEEKLEELGYLFESLKND